MAKDKLTEYDATAANNTVVGDVNLAENSALPSDMNNAVREVMSHLKGFASGTDAIDALTVTGAATVNGAFTSPGIDDNADATAITIDSSENVGISNNIPSSFNAGANNLVVGSGSGSEGITIYGGAESNIFFADGTATADNLRGRIEYSHSSDVMSLYTNNAFAARIDSSGNVGISTSAPVANLEIEDGGTSNTILTKITADDQNPYALMIGNDSYSATDTNAFGFVQRNDGAAYIYNGGALRAAFHSVNSGVLSLEGGVVLGAGAANSTTANTLSDYEEGLHVTTATPSTSGTVTLNSSADTMAYTKIGRLVLITGEISISSVSSPVGTVVDFTVPFACSSLSEQAERAGGGVFWTENGVGYHVIPFLTFSGSIIRIFKDASAFSANDSITFGVSYLTDS